MRTSICWFSQINHRLFTKVAHLPRLFSHWSRQGNTNGTSAEEKVHCVIARWLRWNNCVIHIGRGPARNEIQVQIVGAEPFAFCSNLVSKFSLVVQDRVLGLSIEWLPAAANIVERNTFMVAGSPRISDRIFRSICSSVYRCILRCISKTALLSYNNLSSQ